MNAIIRIINGFYQKRIMYLGYLYRDVLFTVKLDFFFLGYSYTLKPMSIFGNNENKEKFFIVFYEF